MCRSAFLLLIFVVSPQIASAQWSVFDPIEKALPPAVEDPDWTGAVDRFVYARLREAGLSPAPEIDRRTWLRRVTFDLIGLPPSPSELRAFLLDPHDDETAMASVVDRLLASPAYGERWGRHWLDVVRYADTDGFAIDAERLSLWRFRDYVIRILNEDQSFDEFIRAQVAGDELDLGDRGSIALSFYRLGPYEQDNMTPQNRRQDYLNEVTNTIGSAFLGLSVGCARCHDHKFDPILQSDFYQLQAFVTPIKRETMDAAYLPGEWSPAVKSRYERTVAARLDKIRQLKNRLKSKLAESKGVAPNTISDEALKSALDEKTAPLSQKDVDALQKLETGKDELAPEQRFEPKVVAISNPAEDEELPKTFVLNNGDVFDPADRVLPGFLSFAPDFAPQLLGNAEASADLAQGRRKLLAQWLTHPDNPITPRVLVNRIWQYHFGVGIVSTPNDFGENGSGPSHPALLDFLARRLIQLQWKLKPLHRELVLSRTYRSSTVPPDFEEASAVDPDNRLLWRSHYRRLEAETIRDAMLLISGELNRERGGPGFFELLPAGMESSYSFFQWKPSSLRQRQRRSVYMFQRRNLVHPMMETFDGADLNQSCERRQTSVTAPQALSLFNSNLSHDRCRTLARRLRASSPDDSGRIEQLFQLALARIPDRDEFDWCRRFLQARRELARQSQPDPIQVDLLALRDLCLAIMNTNEFLYLD